MAKALRCDRCGDYYSSEVRNKNIDGFYANGVRIITSHVNHYKDFDLCSKCVNELYEFLNIDEVK